MTSDFSILIVEDDDDARRNMEDLLSLDGYQTESVAHCLPAIEAVKHRRFDAVIVDWRLPDGDGGELIELILQHEPNTPVVVVTGFREFDTAVKALRSGAYDFLLKPINPEVLRSVLRRLVERKQHLAELKAAEAKLLESERLAAIGQMVAGLAHETRNAFQRSHACLAELSLDLQSLPDSLQLVHKIQNALDDVHHLLEEVREYSANIVLDQSSCDLTKLIADCWQKILDARHALPSPQFEIKISNDLPDNCLLDPNRMGQVLRNLLENAWSACASPGRIVVDLNYRADSDRRIVMGVSDNGPGVPPENRESIFAPFFTTKTRGTGLGLAISKRIVEAHQGRLTVGSSSLGGARFEIDIPFRQTRTWTRVAQTGDSTGNP